MCDYNNNYYVKSDRIILRFKLPVPCNYGFVKDNFLKGQS